MSYTRPQAMPKSPGEEELLSIGRYESAHGAWMASLKYLAKHGKPVPGVNDRLSVGSHFGEARRDTVELVGQHFSIVSPRSRIISSSARPVNLSYAIANTIWVLSGLDDLETINFFNGRGSLFSDDGRKLFSAPGIRIFPPKGINQFVAVIEQLQADPSSRRATVQIALPGESSYKSRDVSCIISLQFLLRDNKLTCITTMRSQSVLMVMPYDLFLFTMIQEAAATRLGVELGPYHHFSGSFHYYLDEQDVVDRALSLEEPALSGMCPMTEFSETTRQELKAALCVIRNCMSQGKSVDFKAFELDEYWTVLLKSMVSGHLPTLSH